MGVKRLLEVGIVVRDLDKAIESFTGILGLSRGRTDTYDRYRMRYNLCSLGDVYFEFIEATDSRGAIAESIQKRGEGIHHIAFQVSSLDETMARLRRIGVRFVEETPLFLDVSYGRVKFTFAHPKSFHGVLVELIEIL